MSDPLAPYPVNLATPVFNIGWTQGAPEVRLLSNFAPTPFVLDGVTYGCVEAFWQSLKYPPNAPARASTAALTDGFAAKRAGGHRQSKTLEYQDRTYQVGGAAHHQLFERALRAKFGQYPEARACLLATGEARLTHVLFDGRQQPLPDSVALPAAVFCGLLVTIRRELREHTFTAERPLPASDAARAPTQLGLF